METLEAQVSALTNSRRWKVGDALVNLHRRVLLRPKEPVVTQQMDEVFGRFHAWREGDRPTDGDVPTEGKEPADG
jgi:hypothetical protein